MDKVVITAAITGAITSKEKNPNLPISPEEIIDSAYKCYCAGASIIHIHVRNDFGLPSLDYDKYKQVIEGIKSKCNVLICISTSSYGVNIDDDKRLKLLDLNTDLATLTFGNIVRKNGTNSNSDYYIESAFKKMIARKIIPEIEIFNEEMLLKCIEYFKSSQIKPFIQLVFGADGGMDGDYKTFERIMALVPKTWLWSAAATGKNQLPVNLLCVLRNGNIIRTGFEDNVNLRKGILAQSNDELLRRLTDFLHHLNKEIATPAETKSMFYEYFGFINAT